MWEEFKNRSIDVSVPIDDVDAFLQACEDHDIIWNSGRRPTENQYAVNSIRGSGSSNILFYFNLSGRMQWSAFNESSRTVVGFDELLPGSQSEIQASGLLALLEV